MTGQTVHTDLADELADHADAFGRMLIEQVAPYVRPWARAHELATTTTPLPFDDRYVVGLHTEGRAAGALTVGDRHHDTGVPLTLLLQFAATKLPA